MSRWDDFKFEEKIVEILQGTKYIKDNHHLRRPFLSAYQLAIDFALRFPDDFNQLNLQIGGKGIGEHNSLAQYIANRLSQKIKEKKLPNVEGGFFSNKHLRELNFSYLGKDIESSLTHTPYDLSIFRWVGP